MTNMKGVFCCDKGNSVTRKNGIKKLNNLISKNLNCKSYVAYSQDKAVIYVPEDKYQDCLYVGKKYAQMYDIDLYWLNVRGEPRPLYYVSMMYGLLPDNKTSAISQLNIDKATINEIEMYICNLEHFLGNKKVDTIYNKADNAIEFLVKTSLDDYELTRQQCEGFNYIYRNKPFIKILFFENDGILNRDDFEVAINDIELKSDDETIQKRVSMK